MAKMVNPELEAVRFENEDVIATSWIEYKNGIWVDPAGHEVAENTPISIDGKTTSTTGNTTGEQGRRYYIGPDGKTYFYNGN